MIKQSNIVQIQRRVGNINGYRAAYPVAAGQGDLCIIGHLQYTVAGDAVAKGAVKTAQRQGIARPCQRHAG
ncbi:Uncharacterised protein [Yersinia similis]|uniref:Uncharacterized protein n=1 Tax=Yersinia similis TaxID=367190 RepID=A0A0T9RUC4_9GAMM|nr:Uncharacterised protein [Yersinia similis]CNI85688.1 Uncharacterised protein [Yersinia similis]